MLGSFERLRTALRPTWFRMRRCWRCSPLWCVLVSQNDRSLFKPKILDAMAEDLFRARHNSGFWVIGRKVIEFHNEEGGNMKPWTTCAWS